MLLLCVLDRSVQAMFENEFPVKKMCGTLGVGHGYQGVDLVVGD